MWTRGGLLFLGLAAVALVAAPAHPQGNVDCLSFTRTTAPNPYVPGANLVVTVTYSESCSEAISALGLVETPPEGWVYISSGGASPPDTRPDVGETGELEFSWISAQAYPFSYTYTIRPPASASGENVISGTAEYRVGTGTAQFAGPVDTTVTDGVIICQDQPGCVSYTRTASNSTYPPGAAMQFTVNVTEACASPLEALSITEDLPPGWRFASAEGPQVPTVQPEPGTLGALTFSWIEGPPTLPATFTYTVAVPATAVGQQQVSGEATWRTCDVDLTSPGPGTTLDQGDSPLAECNEQCTAAFAVDTDNDTLNDCVEACLGSDPTLLDTDEDGIPDGDEANSGTNPVDVTDGLGDLDNDGDSNLREFLAGTALNDPSDPAPSFYVDQQGADTPEGGTLEAPWRTIPYALAQLDAKGEGPAKLLLEAGIYIGALTLRPGLALISRAPCIEEEFGDCTAIVGPITGAEGAALRNLVVTVNVTQPEAALLTLNDVAMDVEDVTFIGTSDFLNTGITCEGDGPGAGTVDNCRFEQLDVGIAINGCHPKIFGSTFRDHFTAYMVFADTGAAPCGGSLGKAGDPNTGWNRFVDSTGISIINQGSGTVVMERNDWDTDDLAFIDARVNGPVDFDPPIPAGSNLLAGALFCSVLKSSDRSPVENATVSLGASNLSAVTDNDKGVYGFAVIPEGSYTITVTAPGFKGQQMPVFVQRGGIESALFTLAAGDDPDPEPTPTGCQCPAPGKAVPLSADLGSALVGALTLLTLALARVLNRNLW